MKKNQKGFATPVIAAVLVVAVVGVSGWLVYKSHNKPKASSYLSSSKNTTLPAKKAESAKLSDSAPTTQLGLVSGVFVQQQGASVANTQDSAPISLTVDNPRSVSMVQWYLSNFDSGSLKYTTTAPVGANTYQYNCPVSGLAGGTYRWLAKIIDKKGNYKIVQNSAGNPYIDMTISSNTDQNTGTVSGSFVQQEGTYWPKTQKVAYVGIRVSDVTQISKVVWYLGDFSQSSILNTDTSGINDQQGTGSLYQYNWPIDSLSPGTYRVLAKVFDKSGNTQVVTNNQGNPYVDMRVKL